jgi:two-component system chemotaxis response regulator CheY
MAQKKVTAIRLFMAHVDDVFKKINILVVDDMESMRSMVASCLRALGAEKLYFAGNGNVAWEELSNRRIDLIICDWDMPQATGLELLQRVRTTETTRHIPFLMLTASVEKERVYKAIEAGVNDYLAKPFKPTDLDYRVIKLLRKIKVS